MQMRRHHPEEGQAIPLPQMPQDLYADRWQAKGGVGMIRSCEKCPRYTNCISRWGAACKYQKGKMIPELKAETFKDRLKEIERIGHRVVNW